MLVYHCLNLISLKLSPFFLLFDDDFIVDSFVLCCRHCCEEEGWGCSANRHRSWAWGACCRAWGDFPLFRCLCLVLKCENFLVMLVLYNWIFESSSIMTKFNSLISQFSCFLFLIFFFALFCIGKENPWGSKQSCRSFWHKG